MKRIWHLELKGLQSDLGLHLVREGERGGQGCIIIKSEIEVDHLYFTIGVNPFLPPSFPHHFSHPSSDPPSLPPSFTHQIHLMHLPIHVIHPSFHPSIPSHSSIHPSYIPSIHSFHPFHPIHPFIHFRHYQSFTFCCVYPQTSAKSRS